MKALLLFLPLLALSAQRLSIGVKGGVRTLDDVTGFSVVSQESKRYLIGPMVEVRLPLHFSVEADALYRRFGYTSAGGSALFSLIRRERSNSWEFPIIVKYHFPAHLFAGAGYDPRTVHGTDVSSGAFLSDLHLSYYFNQRASADYPLTHGLVILGGVDLPAGPLRISPEVRYVRWNAPFLNQVGGDGSYFIQSTQNEFQIMLGISWH